MGVTNRLSPGFDIREIDLTQTANAATGNNGAFAALLSWGPANLPTLLSTEENLLKRFGRPTNDFYRDWFNISEYLAEANSAWISRVLPSDSYNAFIGGNGSGLTVDVVAVNGEVTSATLNAAGTGYAVGDIFEISGTTLVNAEGKVLTVDGAGAVLTFDIVVSGTGYTVNATQTTATKATYQFGNEDDLEANINDIPEIIAKYPGALANNIGVSIMRASEMDGSQWEPFFRKYPDSSVETFDGVGIESTFTLAESGVTDQVVTLRDSTIQEGTDPGEYSKVGDVITIIKDSEDFTVAADTEYQWTLANAFGLDVTSARIYLNGDIVDSSQVLFNTSGNVADGYYDINTNTGVVSRGRRSDNLSGDGINLVWQITETDATFTNVDFEVFVDGTQFTPVTGVPNVGEVQVAVVAGGYSFTFEGTQIPTNDVNNIQIFWNHLNPGDVLTVDYGLPNGVGDLKIFYNQTAIHAIVYDATGKITGNEGEILERYINLPIDPTAVFENGLPSYYPRAISDSSAWIYLNGTVTNFVDSIMTNGTDGTNTSIDSDYIKAFESFISGDNFVDVQYFVDPCISVTVSKAINNLAQDLGTSVGFVGTPLNTAVNNSSNVLRDTILYRNELGSTSYGTMNCAWQLIYDRYNAVDRWIPTTGVDAGLYSKTHTEINPWTTAAGYNRGQYRRAKKISWLPTEAERDELYAEGINFVVRRRGIGYYLFGQKTLLAETDSGFNRNNVRFLSNHVKVGVRPTMETILFEINDEITRASVRNRLTPFLRSILAGRGIYAFTVKCDADNNPPEVIDANELVCSIYIQPARVSEFIRVDLVYTQTGISFVEVQNF